MVKAVRMGSLNFFLSNDTAVGPGCFVILSVAKYLSLRSYKILHIRSG